ncbi:ribbon-helix-helix domain-containing protein [Zavarzinia compransoris]|uniref:ribbon-helix-helix domain-containing protein n=1 Tax=Zavarzinia marina TaxID=2911065 RepID=UPI001F3C5C9D|nr:ribbon-helix-helix domain-containing protein [Zavarzinia marina]MCF4166084.1 ribbon-helix-helix domain-containing protein [Zavarzinia marina]
MCRLFIGADPSLWASRAKSLRLGGMVTSIRLEDYFWRILEEIAARDGLTVNRLIARLHDEAVDAGHDPGNFTSFLRVCCARYLGLLAAGELPAGRPIRSLDAAGILAREEAGLLSA